MNRTRTLWTNALAATSLWIAIGAVGCSKPAADPAAADDQKPTVAVHVVEVKVQTVPQYVDLEGSFSPAQGGFAKLTAPIPGRMLAVLVKEGAYVKKGQILARLDSRVQSAQQLSAAQAFRSAQIVAQQAQTALQSGSADQSSSVTAAALALEQAHAEGQSAMAQAQFTLVQSQADYDRLKNGARPLELAQAHEATIQARAIQQKAKNDLNRDQSLFPQGYVARKQLEQDQTTLETATSALSAAEDSENLLKQGPRKEEIAAAEAKLQSARNAYESAIQVSRVQLQAAKTALRHARSGVLSVKAKQQDVENTQALAAQKGADLAAAQATATLFEVRAPFDGKVVKVTAAPGETVDVTTPILSIRKSGAGLDFLANALPSQAEQVHPGARAVLETKQGTVQGRVLEISLPDPSSSYSVARIAAEGDAASGSFGTAHIVVRTLKNALVVPTTCIADKDGKPVVFKNVDGVAKQTEVELGPEANGLTAILSGVKLGDSIVASGANELDDGSKITVPSEKDDKAADGKDADEKKGK